VFKGHHGVVGRHSQMPGVADSYHPQSHVFGFLDGYIHGFRGNDRAQAPVRVDGGRAWRLPHHLPVRTGIDLAALKPGYVAFEHVRYAVGINAPQVG